MSITVKFMGILAVRAKTTEKTIEFFGKTIEDLFALLSEKYDMTFLDEFISPSGELKIIIQVNSESASLETALEDGDLVAFLQAVYGG